MSLSENFCGIHISGENNLLYGKWKPLEGYGLEHIPDRVDLFVKIDYTTK